MNLIRGLTRCLPHSRSVSTSSPRTRDLTRLKELQRQFQVDDGVPVYLKRGASDQFIFACVLMMIGIGLIDSFRTVKKIIYPPPNN